MIVRDKIKFSISKALVLAIISLSSVGYNLSAQDDSAPRATAEQEKIERVGGNYLVRSVHPLEGGFFRIEFKSEPATGKFDTIVLESDHIHVAVQTGQTLRISAEIAYVKDRVAYASQVLLFIPRAEGSMPIWMLSKSGKGHDLRGSKYLEMHAPQSDYVIF